MNYTNQSDRQGHSPCETAVIILVRKWQAKIKRGGSRGAALAGRPPRSDERRPAERLLIELRCANRVAPTELRQPLWCNYLTTLSFPCISE